MLQNYTLPGAVSCTSYYAVIHFVLSNLLHSKNHIIRNYHRYSESDNVFTRKTKLIKVYQFSQIRSCNWRDSMWFFGKLSISWSNLASCCYKCKAQWIQQWSGPGVWWSISSLLVSSKTNEVSINVDNMQNYLLDSIWYELKKGDYKV